MGAQIGAMQAPHLNAMKGQAVQLGGVAPGAMQTRERGIAGTRSGLDQSRRRRRTGQLRDTGRGKHRASRRAGRLG